MGAAIYIVSFKVDSTRAGKLFSRFPVSRNQFVGNYLPGQIGVPTKNFKFSKTLNDKNEWVGKPFCGKPFCLDELVSGELALETGNRETNLLATIDHVQFAYQ